MTAAWAALDESPHEALRLAERLVDAPDPATAAAAHRVAALAARELHDVPASTRHFEAALALASDEAEAAMLRLSLAGNHALAGRFADAHRVLDELAAGDGLGDDRYLIEVQRASVLHIEDRFEETVAVTEELLASDAPLGAARRAHLLGNLGSALMQLGRLGDCRAALAASLAAYREAGELRPQLDVLTNIALAEAWALRIPRAIRAFEEAGSLASRLGVQDGVGRLDQARAFVEMGLGAEASRAAAQAVELLGGAGEGAWLGKAHLVAALALWQVGRLDDAEAAAARAADVFTEQGREGGALLARKVGWTARLERDPGDVAAPLAVADALAAAGYATDAQELRTQAALAAFEAGDAGAGRAAARLAAEFRDESSASQIRACLARALDSHAGGDRDAAFAALDAGLAVLEEHRATLGATELRARSSGLGTRLAAFGLHLAFEEGDAATVFSWAERLRANSLDQPPGAGPSPELSDALAALRQASAASRVTGDAGAVDAARNRVTTLLRARPGEGGRAGGPSAARPPPRTVAFVEHRGRLHRLEVAPDGGIALAGTTVAVEAARDAVRGVGTAWRRWLRHRGRPAAATYRSTVDEMLRRLDEALGLTGLDWPPGLIIPSESLFAVPWRALPSLDGTAPAVSPSLSLATREATATGDGVVAVAGPDLAHADDEVAAVAGCWPAALTFGAGRSAVAEVAAAVPGRAVAHFAAHGVFNSSRPLFSALELADGPLTVIDLEGLPRPPAVAVLSACDAGAHAVHPGSELLGLVAGFLAIGCSSVVAPLFPIVDATAVPVMRALHHELAAGAAPAAALTAAAQSFDPGSDEGLAARSFVAFGAA